MSNTDNKYFYDVIIFGAGIAGLWLANTLKRAGYNVILIEKDKVGGVQSIASQGMIHGGQKYTISGKVTGHAASLAEMPGRWEACFDGYGEIDLTSARFLSDTQTMWPAGTLLSGPAVFAASKAVNAGTSKMKPKDFTPVYAAKKNFKGPVYVMPEKVLEIKSVVQAMMKPLDGRVLKGEAAELLPDGQVAVGGLALSAQVIIFTAGTGNETALELLKVATKHAQRRPLRQIMVKTLPNEIFAHGIVGAPKPRLTVTSHPIDGGYVWYMGGNMAELSWKMSEDEALAFAKKEMEDVFPEIDWKDKEWATWYGDRAEPYDATGELPPGPFIHQRGRVLIAWPTKLTFAPGLSDRVFDWLKEKEIEPASKNAPPPLPAAEIASYPWETAVWRKLP